MVYLLTQYSTKKIRTHADVVEENGYLGDDLRHWGKVYENSRLSSGDLGLYNVEVQGCNYGRRGTRIVVG